MSKFAHKQVNRRSVIKGAAATGLGLGAASSIYLPTAFGRQEKGEVVAWVTHSNDDLKSIQGIVEEFNAQSDTTAVKLEQVPGSETDSAKLITAVRGGTGPDAYMLDRFVVPERAAGGLLQDLTEPLTNAGMDPDLKNTYVEFAANEATWDGKPYALPFDSDARGLYVNLDMIEEAGGDPAAFDTEADPQVWDDLVELLSSLNVEASSGNFERVGMVPWFEQGSAYSWGFMWGATFFDKEACEVTPDNERMVAAMQWVADYSSTYGAEKLAAAITTQEGAPPSENPFLQGRIASMYTGDWMIKILADYAPDIRYAIAKPPVPAAGDQSVSWAGGWSWVIPQGAKNVDGAGEFLAYVAGEPGQTKYTVDTAHLPTISALMDKEELYDPIHAKFAAQLLPIATNRPPLPVGAKYWDELGAAYEYIYLGEQDPETALAQAKENTMTLLSPFCPVN